MIDKPADYSIENTNLQYTISLFTTGGDIKYAMDLVY